MSTSQHRIIIPPTFQPVAKILFVYLPHKSILRHQHIIMAEHNDFGAWGEERAREYLITHGYTIIEHDTRKGGSEIDLIALKNDRIIFIEVKTRREGSFDPMEAITPKKIRNICRAADNFVRTYNYRQEVQFDIICVVGSSEHDYTIEHLPDAFYPPLG